MKKKRNNYGPILSVINGSPELISLLYDLNRLPEQLKRNSRKWRDMCWIVVGYMAGKGIKPTHKKEGE